MTADYELRYAAMGLSGSFWARMVTPETRDQLRSVTSLMANASGLQRMDEPVNKLLSQRRVLVEQIVVPYLEGDVAFVGPDLFDYWRGVLGVDADAPVHIARLDVRVLMDPGPTTDNGVFVASVGSVGDFPGTEALHLVPMPVGITPLVIATRDADRVLVSGVDFEAREGFIVMRESPGLLFRPGGVVIVSAVKELDPPYNFTNHVDGRPYGNRFTTIYQRLSQSRVAFERAAAEAAGMLVLPHEDTLVIVREIDGGTRYVFEHLGVIDVFYPHDPLHPGRTYPEGFIVTDRFSIVTGNELDSDWVNRLTTGETFSLDGILPVKGLTLPRHPCLVDWVDQTGGKVHARIHLDGDTPNKEAYWDAQKEHELRTGVYFSDVLGMDTTTSTLTINFASVISGYYGDALLVVRLGMADADAGFKTRLLSFLQREKPLGSVLLIAD